MRSLSNACRITQGWLLRPTTIMPGLHYSIKAKKNSTEPLTQKQVLMKLRKDTGYPLFKCKQALINTEYNIDQALEELKANAAREGWHKMQKVGGREASQGLVTAHKIGHHAAMLEINCESDFVTKTSQFQNFVGKVTLAVLKHFSDGKERIDLSTDDILPLSVQGKKTATVSDVLASLVGSLGENIVIKRGVITSVENNDQEFLGIYTHPDIDTPNKGGSLPLMGHYAAIVGMRTTAMEPQGSAWLRAKGRDLAQHVIGMSPVLIGNRIVGIPEVESEVTPDNSTEEMKIECNENQINNIENLENELDEINSNGELFKDDMFDDGGETISHSDELLQQSFLLDSNITVQNWLDINRLDINYFVRYHLGSN